jgi:hypothetical protein
MVIFTDINIAKKVLKNMSVVKSIAHLAPETASGRTRIYALVSARSLALVIVLHTVSP